PCPIPRLRRRPALARVAIVLPASPLFPPSSASGGGPPVSSSPASGGGSGGGLRIRDEEQARIIEQDLAVAARREFGGKQRAVAVEESWPLALVEPRQERPQPGAAQPFDNRIDPVHHLDV